MKNVIHEIGVVVEGSIFLKVCMVILLAALLIFIDYIFGYWFGNKLFR